MTNIFDQCCFHYVVKQVHNLFLEIKFSLSNNEIIFKESIHFCMKNM